MFNFDVVRACCYFQDVVLDDPAWSVAKNHLGSLLEKVATSTEVDAFLKLCVDTNIGPDGAQTAFDLKEAQKIFTFVLVSEGLVISQICL